MANHLDPRAECRDSSTRFANVIANVAAEDHPRALAATYPYIEDDTDDAVNNVEFNAERSDTDRPKTAGEAGAADNPPVVALCSSKNSLHDNTRTHARSSNERATR
jgi:hypothetical protein